MFKALWPPAAVAIAAACLFAAAFNYLHRDGAKQPAAAPEIVPLRHKQPLPYRLDDGRQAPAEATMTGQLHATSYVSPAAARPAVSAAEQQAARIGNFSAPQVRWVYYPPPQQPRVVYSQAAAPHKHYRRGPVRRLARLLCRR